MRARDPGHQNQGAPYKNHGFQTQGKSDITKLYWIFFHPDTGSRWHCTLKSHKPTEITKAVGDDSEVPRKDRRNGVGPGGMYKAAAQ